jgi:hypothetical protein
MLCTKRENAQKVKEGNMANAAPLFQRASRLLQLGASVLQAFVFFVLLIL